MIRATPVILATALAAAIPAAAQTDPPPTVETVQHGLDAFFAQPHDGITVSHIEDNMKKTSLLVRDLGASKTVRRCETEFTTPTASISANAKAERTWRIAWGSLAEVRYDGAFKVELIAKNQPVGARTIIEVPDSNFAPNFAAALDFLRQNCAG
jgi:hypothetical protein